MTQTQHNPTILNKTTTTPTTAPAVVKPIVAPTLVKRPPPTLAFVDIEDISKYVNMLVIGRQGVGKTLLAASAAEDPRVEGILYIDVEEGVKTGADYLKKYHDKFHVVYIGDDPISDMNKFIRYAKVATNKERAAEEGLPYINTVVIDSITSLADKLISHISGTEKAISSGEVPRGSQIQEWGTQKSMIESWVQTFKRMPCHLIVTCLEHLGEDEVTKVKVPQPLLPAKLGSKLPSIFDYVFYYETDKKAPQNSDGSQPRVLQCLASKTHESKTRTPRSRPIPATIADPTVKILYNHFFEAPSS